MFDCQSFFIRDRQALSARQSFQTFQFRLTREVLHGIMAERRELRIDAIRVRPFERMKVLFNNGITSNATVDAHNYCRSNTTAFICTQGNKLALVTGINGVICSTKRGQKWIESGCS